MCVRFVYVCACLTRVLDDFGILNVRASLGVDWLLEFRGWWLYELRCPRRDRLRYPLSGFRVQGLRAAEN